MELSTLVFLALENHPKCSSEEKCHFCLTRSVLIRINESKGRQTMIPVEMEAMDFSGMDRTWGFLHDTLNKCAQSNSHLKKCLKPVIKCLKCKTLISDGNIGLSMFVDPDRRNQNIVDLIESKLKSALELHQSSTNCNEDLYAVFGEDQKMLIVHAWSMKVEDLNEKSMNTKICSFWIINRSQSLYFKNSFFNTTNCKEARKCHLTNLIPCVSSVSADCSNGKNVSFSINNRPNNLRFFFNLHTPFTDTYILYSPSCLSRLLCYG